MKKKISYNEPRSTSSCAACKLLKRKCSIHCIFAPYFRADEPKKFAKVHKVFGASNVSKILQEVPEEHREEAVNSLTYEAEARLRDPVYGCIGPIAFLHRRMVELQRDLAFARARLAAVRGAGVHSLPYYDGDNVGSGSGTVLELPHDQVVNMPSLGDNGFGGGLSQSDSSGGSQLSPNPAYNNDFGQVPILPL